MRGTRLRWAMLAMAFILGTRVVAQGDGRGKASSPDILPIDSGLISSEATRQESLEDNLKRGSIDLGQSSIQYWTKNPTAAKADSYPPEKENLAIVDFAPTGELPIEMQRPTIYVMFNLPMVPVAKLGEPIASTPLMAISPSVRGVYRWYGTKVLSFQPEGSMVDQPRYTVTISKDAASLGGRRLGTTFTFEFHTETVKIVNFHAGGPTDAWGAIEVPTAVARRLIFEFNQPVDPDFIKRFIAVKLDNVLGGRSISFDVGRPDYPAELQTRKDRGVQVTLSADPPENAKLILTLRDKAMPFDKFPARSGDQTLSLRTVTPFRLKELESYSYDAPLNNKPGTVPIYARFTHALARALPPGSIAVTVNGRSVQSTALEVFGGALQRDNP